MMTKRTALFGGALFLAVALVACAVMTPAIDVSAIGHYVAGIHDHHSVIVASAGLAALRQRRVDIHDKMAAIINTAETEDRDLSDEEAAEFDKLKAEKGALDKRIERGDDLEASTALLDRVVPAASRNGGIERAGGPEAAREFESFADFLSAVRFRPNDPRLAYTDNPAAFDPATGELRAEFRVDNGPSGGFMIPNQLRDTIMRVDPQDALVRPRAEVIPAGDPPDSSVTMGALDQTGSNPGNMFGGMTMTWIGEGDDKPETDAKLREITLTPHEIAGTAVITDKMLRNWQASRTFIESLMRGAVNAAEDYAFLRGSGTAQPLGVVNAGATKWINRATANHVAYADLVGMVARLLMRGNAQTAVWSIPQAAMVDITTMTDPEGHYIWQPNARDGMAGTLLGYPVRWNNRAPALGSKGDIILADWSYYLIKDGSGPYVAMSEHVLFRQNKTVFKVFWNVDGSPWLTAPIKEENGYDVSPFVGLDVPA
jgi:HK97 family phage major capsid protein